jgi:small Trp-rich protein
MWFVGIGVLLVVLKLADFGPPAAWSWWVIVAPFFAAVAWWGYADSTGLTKRREMDKLEERKLERRRKNMEALGIDRNQQKLADAAGRARRAAAERVEGGRSAKREAQEKVIRDSVFDSSQQSSSFDDKGDAAAKKDKKKG